MPRRSTDASERTFMNSPHYFGVKVDVGSYAFVGFGQLAPFLDELNERYNSVAAKVHDFEPPAAGFSEIAITVAVTAPVAYLSSFLATWAAEDAKALRQKMLDLMHRNQENEHGRRYLPMRIEIGRVRFYLHEQLTDEELVQRLRAAQDYTATLPEQAFDGEAGPGEFGLFWDKNSETWKGGIYGFREERCAPERLLSADPGEVICYES